MKQTYFLFLVIAILFQFSCEDDMSVIYQEPENLIQGYSFESDNLEKWWSFYQTEDSYTLIRSEEEAFDGIGSLLLSSEITTNESFAFWQTRITNTEEGKSYKVRARVKGKNIDANSFEINMFARNPDNSSAVISGLSGKLSPDKNWEEITVELSSALSSGFEYVDIYFVLAANVTGTVFIDKVELFY